MSLACNHEQKNIRKRREKAFKRRRQVVAEVGSRPRFFWADKQEILAEVSPFVINLPNKTISHRRRNPST